MAAPASGRSGPVRRRAQEAEQLRPRTAATEPLVTLDLAALAR